MRDARGFTGQFFVPDRGGGPSLTGVEARRAWRRLKAEVEDEAGSAVSHRLVQCLRFKWSDGSERTARVGAPDPFDGGQVVMAIFEVEEGFLILTGAQRRGAQGIPVRTAEGLGGEGLRLANRTAIGARLSFLSNPEPPEAKPVPPPATGALKPSDPEGERREALEEDQRGHTGDDPQPGRCAEK